MRFFRHTELSLPWADRAIENAAVAKYIFNAFVTALHEQQQLDIENKVGFQTIFSVSIYQRYVQTPKTFLDPALSKNRLGKNGR